MKKIVTSIIFSSIIFAGPITESFSVKGMMCGVGCANKVNSVLTSIDGVKSCNVDFELEKVTVIYEDQKLSSSDIVDAITSKTTYKCAIEEPKQKGFWQRLFSL